MYHIVLILIHFILFFSGTDSQGQKTSKEFLCQKIISTEIFDITEDIETPVPGVKIKDYDEENRIYGVPRMYGLILAAQYGVLSFSKYENIPIISRNNNENNNNDKKDKNGNNIDNNGKDKSVTIVGTLGLLNQIITSLYLVPTFNYYGNNSFKCLSLYCTLLISFHLSSLLYLFFIYFYSNLIFNFVVDIIPFILFSS